jgi:FKBP-type peptidyl-prolyl cis-trans isomerase SlyD
MQIEKDRVVSIDYTLTSPQGDVLDSSKGRQPLTYLHGAGNLIPGLEAALQGKTAGHSFSVTVAPEDAYGIKDPARVQAVPRSAFSGVPEIKPGMQFQARGPHGVQIVTVVSADDQTVTVDANHPLAGMSLKFDVTIVDVRQATEQELSHGHIHGGAGCQGGEGGCGGCEH